MAENESQGITRRDLLKRGAALGGAVVWATPVVQTLGMGRAFAQTASPCTPAVSFIAMCVTCDGVQYLIKWEAPGKWDTDDPVCNTDDMFCPGATPRLGDELGFSVTADGAGCFTVSGPCTVTAVRVFGGGVCETVYDATQTVNPFDGQVCCPGFN